MSDKSEQPRQVPASEILDFLEDHGWTFERLVLAINNHECLRHGAPTLRGVPASADGGAQ